MGEDLCGDGLAMSVNTDGSMGADQLSSAVHRRVDTPDSGSRSSFSSIHLPEMPAVKFISDEDLALLRWEDEVIAWLESELGRYPTSEEVEQGKQLIRQKEATREASRLAQERDLIRQARPWARQRAAALLADDLHRMHLRKLGLLPSARTRCTHVAHGQMQPVSAGALESARMILDLPSHGQTAEGPSGMPGSLSSRRVTDLDAGAGGCRYLSPRFPEISPRAVSHQAGTVRMASRASSRASARNQGHGSRLRLPHDDERCGNGLPTPGSSSWRTGKAVDSRLLKRDRRLQALVQGVHVDSRQLQDESTKRRLMEIAELTNFFH